MLRSLAMLALWTRVFLLFAPASASRADDQHILSPKDINEACRVSNDCYLDYYCLHDKCTRGCDHDDRCKQPDVGLPHKICSRDNSCVSGCRVNENCATGEICTLNKCEIPIGPTCGFMGGKSLCTRTDKQIAFFPGTFTPDECGFSCREVSTNCQSFAVSAVPGAFGCYLYNESVALCGGQPGASSWAYSDRGCPNGWKSPACGLVGGGTYCTGTSNQIVVIPGTFTPSQCSNECKATLSCRSFAVSRWGGPNGCYLFNQGVSVCHGEPGTTDWAYFDYNCPISA